MSELLEAPTPVITEDPVEDLDVPDMVGHLYYPNVLTTLCGISDKNDPHERMHVNYKLSPGIWAEGVNACPECGAPICPKCEALAID